MSLVVAKFGGTSMGSAEAISETAAILQKSPKPVVAVVSAVSRVTDQLLLLGKLALENKDWSAELTKLTARHDQIIKDLQIKLDLTPFYEELTKLLQGISLIQELSPCKKDYLVSFGERMSSLLLSAKLKALGLKSERLDSFDLVITDDNYLEANVDFSATNQLIIQKVKPLLKSGVIPVITGFIGQSKSGHYSTLGRGGSDYSGAIFAAALSATELQIWTDVEGIFSSDPRVIKNARPLEEVSFAEAGELAYFGAKVLHPKTIIPAIKQNIPVKILNTFHPEAKGTLITTKETDFLKAVTWKKGVTIVHICSSRMLDAHGFLAKIFDLFAQYEIVIDVLATSEVSVSLTINQKMPEKLLAKLNEFAQVETSFSYAIMCLVGAGIKERKGILGELFTALKDHQIDMVSQGSSRRNITWLVKENEAEEVANTVFNKFFI